MYPPLNLQNDFEKIYLQVNKIMTDINSSIPLDNNLFGALSQKSFAGNL